MAHFATIKKRYMVFFSMFLQLQIHGKVAVLIFTSHTHSFKLNVVYYRLVKFQALEHFLKLFPDTILTSEFRTCLGNSGPMATLFYTQSTRTNACADARGSCILI